MTTPFRLDTQASLEELLMAVRVNPGMVAGGSGGAGWAALASLVRVALVTSGSAKMEVGPLRQEVALLQLSAEVASYCTEGDVEPLLQATLGAVFGRLRLFAAAGVEPRAQSLAALVTVGWFAGAADVLHSLFRLFSPLPAPVDVMNTAVSALPLLLQALR
jgi:hypothetical protein